jgi:hypothetical protein
MKELAHSIALLVIANEEFLTGMRKMKSEKQNDFSGDYMKSKQMNGNPGFK